MANTIFVSDALGYKIRHNDTQNPTITLDGKTYSNGEVIVQFNPFRAFSEERNSIMMKGYLILDNDIDKERLEFVKRFPDCNKGYKETNKLPERYSGSMIITGVVGAPPSNEEDREIKRAIKEKALNEGIQKGIRYQELKQKYFKIDGEMKANIDKDDEDTLAELTEYENLKKELNL